MSAKIQDPLPPIVLMVGLPINSTEVRRALGFDTPHATEFFGTSVEYARAVIDTDNKPVWWVDPIKSESMLEVLSFRPSFSPNKYKKWIESPQFVNYVRRDINYMIHYSLTQEGRHGFDPRWHEAIKMVVLGGWVSSDSEYVKRVFDGYFQNAKYWWWNSQDRKLQPIWREAKVVPIEQGSKPTTAEVLDWRVDQVSSMPQGVKNLANDSAYGDPLVKDLVMKQSDDLIRWGVWEPDVAAASEVLEAYGLKFGMTQVEVNRLRHVQRPRDEFWDEVVEQPLKLTPS